MKNATFAPPDAYNTSKFDEQETDGRYLNAGIQY